MNKNFIKVLFWVNAFFFVSNLVFFLIGLLFFGTLSPINAIAALGSLAGVWASTQIQES